MRDREPVAITSTSEKPLEAPYRPTVLSGVGEANLQYRSLNRAAVGSVVMFGLGLTGLMFWQLLILPIAGIMLGYSALRTIRRYPDEYSGQGLARFGMVVCLLLLIGGVSFHTFVYVTEVPEGYDRISFSELQPEGWAPQGLPKRALELRGQKVFVKGYMHPGVAGMNKVNQFVLVPDMSTCCFGGQPKMTDMILVHTTADARLKYGARIVRVAGEFGIGDHLEEFAGVKDVAYRLEADYSK